MAAAERRKKNGDTAAPMAVVELPALAAGDDWGKELVNWLFPAYVTMIVIAVFALRAAAPKGQENLDRALLTAVNTATLTGFPQSIKPDWFNPFGQFIILLLTVAGSLFSLIIGGFAVRRILRLPYSDKQVLAAAGVCEAIALLIGALGLCGTDAGFFGGLTQGAAAFGNSGMSLGQPYGLGAWQTHLVLLPMAFLGGLGVTVLLELYQLLFHGRGLSTHARTVLFVSFSVYLASMIILLVIRGVGGDFSTAPGGAADVFASTSAAAITSRTAGFHLEMTHAWPRAMPWVVIVLMVIGASPGGTGGGVKTTTVAALVGGARRSLLGQAAGRTFGIALCWLGIYLGMALLGVVMLMAAEPQTAADRVVFLSFSALSNVGLAPDVLSVTGKGSYILSALMLAGRMVPWLILWWMADTTEDAELAIG